MSKRLQVLLRDEEFERFREIARQQGVTVSEWVRQILRRAGTEAPATDRARKLDSVRAAARHDFPTADIDEMLAQIESGYRGRGLR